MSHEKGGDASGTAAELLKEFAGVDGFDALCKAFEERLETEVQTQLAAELEHVGTPPTGGLDLSVKGFSVTTDQKAGIVTIKQQGNTITLAAAELPLFIRTLTQAQVTLNRQLAKSLR